MVGHQVQGFLIDCTEANSYFRTYYLSVCWRVRKSYSMYWYIHWYFLVKAQGQVGRVLHARSSDSDFDFRAGRCVVFLSKTLVSVHSSVNESPCDGLAFRSGGTLASSLSQRGGAIVRKVKRGKAHCGYRSVCLIYHSRHALSLWSSWLWVRYLCATLWASVFYCSPKPSNMNETVWKSIKYICHTIP